MRLVQVLLAALLVVQVLTLLALAFGGQAVLQWVWAALAGVAVLVGAVWAIGWLGSTLSK